MNLTNRQYRLLRENSPEDRAFREGAACEAEQRNASTLLHRDLISYVRTMAEYHPEMSDAEIAANVAYVFGATENRVQRAAKVELGMAP